MLARLKSMTCFPCLVRRPGFAGLSQQSFKLLHVAMLELCKVCMANHSGTSLGFPGAPDLRGQKIIKLVVSALSLISVITILS